MKESKWLVGLLSVFVFLFVIAPPLTADELAPSEPATTDPATSPTVPADSPPEASLTETPETALSNTTEFLAGETDGDALGDGGLPRTTYDNEYYPSGNLKKRTVKINGRAVAEYEYKDNPKEEWIKYTTYNDDGSKTVLDCTSLPCKTTVYDKDGKEISITIINLDGNVVKRTTFNDDGSKTVLDCTSLPCKSTVYDKDGKEISITIINLDGTKTVTLSDPSGNKYVVIYNADGSIKEEIGKRQEVELNTNGTVKKITFYENGVATLIREREYNAKGKIEAITDYKPKYEEGKVVKGDMTKKITFEYNTAGSLDKINEFDGNRKLIKSTKLETKPSTFSLFNVSFATIQEKNNQGILIRETVIERIEMETNETNGLNGTIKEKSGYVVKETVYRGYGSKTETEYYYTIDKGVIKRRGYKIIEYENDKKTSEQTYSYPPSL